MDDERGQWYTNKDLFVQIIGLQQEMKETRAIIKKYNGLYDKVNDVKDRIEHIESLSQGKQDFGESIKSWGGWIFGLISVIVLLLTTF